MIKVLFVCLGNICRSPLAEGLFRNKVQKEALDNRIICDSAGTDSFHVGEKPDRRACKIAERYGIAIDGKARNMCKDDLMDFDYVLAMDNQNIESIKRLQQRVFDPRARVHLLREFDTEHKNGCEVPDPYYGGDEGFDKVYRMLDRCTDSFLDFVKKEHFI